MKDAFYSIRLLKETFAPETPQTDRLADTNWTPGCRSGIGSGSSQEDVHTDEIPEVSDDAVADFKEGMAKIARHSRPHANIPTVHDMGAIPDERKTCIEKATKACEVIYSVIAPKDGEKLFQAIREPTANDLDEPTDDLIALMSAYRDAMTKNVTIQILRIYAYRYTMKLLQKFREPYEKISLRQIKIARLHARNRGPGSRKYSAIEYVWTQAKSTTIDFVNRPYFYQDVAFGTRTLTLDGGGKITMSNVIRTVTRSTMIT